jgi:hypothetical protein
MGDISPDLRAAIAQAYRVFGRYTLTRPIEVCGQCYPELADVFAGELLREISPELLCQYVDATACRGYAERMDDDIRYLLPRWLELIAAGESIGRFGDHDGLTVMQPTLWRARWPADEVAALDQYFAALFRDAMRIPVQIGQYHPVPFVRGRDLTWFLYGIGAAGSGAALPLLHIAEEWPDREMDLRIAGLACDIARQAIQEWSPTQQLSPPGPLDADRAVRTTDAMLRAQCSCDRCKQKVAAWEWLAQPGFRERLEASTLHEADPDAARVMSVGEQLIAALVRNRSQCEPVQPPTERMDDSY